jgi:PBSX family phage portal protein
MVSGYGMFDVVEPPYNLEVLASLFEENAVHNACIMARTMNTVGLGYRWEDTPKSKKKVEKATAKLNDNSLSRIRDMLQAEEDRLNELFDNFNIDDSFIETLIKCWIDYLTVGNCYIEIGRNRNGTIGYVGHVPAVFLRVRRGRDGFIQRVGNQWTFFRNFQDKDTKDPINSDEQPNEIIHIKAYSPTNTYYGVPSAVSAIAAIIGDKFAKEYNIDYFENKSIPRYAIILKGASLSPRSKQEIINYFKNEVKGNNHGTLLIPIPATMGKDVDLKFEALENKVQEGSFDKYRKSNRDEITIAHRVPGTKIGIFDNANLAVSRDADKTFKMQVIGPDQTVLQKKINRLTKEFTDLKLFKFAEIDLIDEDLRSRIHDRYLRTEVLVPNEVRQIIGLTPIEDGDKVLPYSSKVQRDKNIDIAGLIPPSYDGLEEKEIEQPEPSTSEGGGEMDNSNAELGSPPKSGQDAANKEGSPADSTIGRNERGQNQDQGGK